MLRTLLVKCYNYSERSLKSQQTQHGPQQNLLNYITRNGKRGYMTYSTYLKYIIYSRTKRTQRTQHTKGFLRSQELYLRTVSPYLRQFSLCSKSQNTIKVNLLGTLLYNRYSPKTCVVYITQPNLYTPQYKLQVFVTLLTIFRSFQQVSN